MNRFWGLSYIPSREILPWEAKKRNLSQTTGLFLLSEDLFFFSDIAEGVIQVPTNFVSDLASIPWYVGWVLNTTDQRISAGAWIHDYLYSVVGKIVTTNSKAKNLTRKQADQILCFEAMPQLGATLFQQKAVYQALRRFGKQWPKNNILERLT